MSLLTENIRWVQSITLEGERLTADDVVVRRDMLAGARIDALGVRLSFIAVAVLFAVNVVASVAAFLETLQFFEPDYSIFALSLLPLIGLGYGAYRLRPRQHITILLRDGSALGVLSRDGNFLTRCLEAFERLWADPMRAKSSLYLHAAHRSVDFGPPAGGIDVLANTPDEGPMALTLPVFGDDEEDVEKAAPQNGDSPPDLPEMPVEEEASEPTQVDDPLPPLPPLSLSDEADDEPITQVSSALDADEPQDDAPEQDDVSLPPLPPQFPEQDESEAPAPNEEQLEESTDEEEPTPEAAPEETDDVAPDEDQDSQPFGDHVGVPAAAFLDVRPKVEALVRLLRERAPAQGISDAVDVLELMTRRGCDTPVEVRALARSVELLRERMSAYPTAVELLDDVAKVGHLKTHPALH
ncbi:MAG: hypothetical protein AAF234_00515 [Pseudomonadota bacterium]